MTPKETPEQMLARCPFCGSEARIEMSAGWEGAYCANEKCLMYLPEMPRVAVWNTRALPQPTHDQFQQLGQALYEIEPFMVSDMPVPWEKLEPETRAKCVKYASVMMAAWRKMGAV